MSGEPFTCPKCGYADSEFHTVCPECGRPFMRDYADTQMHPRDPDPTGVVTMKFWARVFLVLMAGGLFVGVLRLFGLL
jgi:predicted amidophosphoribosyltransferase